MNQIREYSRDSFDRFGDDLCGELLRALRVSDCFRCECVCKQFKRLVFRKPKPLAVALTANEHFNRNLISIVDFEFVINKWVVNCIFEKCAVDEILISHEIAVKEDIIETIGQNCPQLRRIEIRGRTTHFSPETWQLLGQKCGQSLRTICLRDRQDFIHHLFRLTPNLIECEGIDLADCVAGDHRSGQQFFTNLRKIEANYTYGTDFKLFADQYSDKVENISISYDLRVTRELFHEMCQQLSRFKSLRSFRANFLYASSHNDDLLDSLNLLAINCPNLCHLSLSGVDHFLQVFHGVNRSFASLQRLTIKTSSKQSFGSANFECLALCPSLRHFEVEAHDLSDQNFANIDAFAPNLRTIKFYSYQMITNKTLETFARLDNLRSIEIRSFLAKIRDDGLCSLIKGCENLRYITFDCLIYITKTSIDALAERANSNPRLDFAFTTFSDCLIFNDDSSESGHTLSELVKTLPHNLKIIVQ